MIAPFESMNARQGIKTGVPVARRANSAIKFESMNARQGIKTNFII